MILIKMVQTRSMTTTPRMTATRSTAPRMPTRSTVVARPVPVAAVKRSRVAAFTTVPACAARAPYELRPRLQKTTITVTIPQTPYNLRPRIQVA